MTQKLTFIFIFCNRHNQELYTVIDQVRNENQNLKKKLIVLESELERAQLECTSKDKRLANEKQKIKSTNEALKKLQKEIQVNMEQKQR
jgi:peptidoglycan hydrolase CwlO-like protein